MPRGRSQRSSQSQRNRTTQQTLEESFAEVDVTDLVNDLVRYIINRAGQHMAFKRSEIKKNVLSKAGPMFQEIIDKAAKILKDIYGYNMIVVDAAQNLTKTYIISNSLPYINYTTVESEEPREEQYPDDVHKILLMLILSHIFMSNNSISEASLYSFLKSLTIDVERRHELFGNVKDYITNTLKNKKYLEIEMDQLTKKISFSWGIRAEKEISKQEILKFVCKMYKDRIPTSWVNQYKVASEQQYENNKETADI